MYQVRYYNNEDKAEQYVSARKFSSPEAAGLYAQVVINEPDVYASEDEISEMFAGFETVDYSYIIIHA